MEKRVLQLEGLLRLLAVLLSATTACVVGFNTETKQVFFMWKKATVKDLSALWVLTIVASCAAGYEFIQFCKCLFDAWCSAGGCRKCGKSRAWACLLLDQGVMYTMFGSTAAGAQASLIAVTGVHALQWMKACHIYTRFCEQIGGGLFCGLMASLAMCALSSISAYRLFSTHYAGCKQHSPPL
ncbi:hypothetical protein Taro_015426 [Colocasia esculenta]|uniref:CASP-like protein n=1 Tax=Colocasia esculenta TaxID=4460 RepID=A0A843UBF4_COLES|nr:hypothetical protein [Colocasia esculenta]